MKWFKHDSNANTDAKLRRVRIKYGMQGYGLYWYCLELIAQNVEKHNLTFELEHDAEIIADDTNINYELVQEMMLFMVDLGLFENADNRITCMKMATRTDEYTQKLLKNRETVPTISRHTPDKVRSNRIEQKRIEQNRTETNTKWETACPPGRRARKFKPPTLEQVRTYCQERGNNIDPEHFIDSNTAKGWKVGTTQTPMKCWKATIRTWEKKHRSKPGQETGQSGTTRSTRDTTLEQDLQDRSWAE